jgi:hypothetical protein
MAKALQKVKEEMRGKEIDRERVDQGCESSMKEHFYRIVDVKNGAYTLVVNA